MKKGFTLIELLAVIVILGIIALIAIPKVSNAIEDSKKNAAQDSALNYIKAINDQNALAVLDSTKYSKITSGDVTGLNVKMNGEGPTEGNIVVEKGKVVSATLCFNGYQVQYSNNKTTVLGKCQGQEPGLYDDNGNLLASWNQLVNTYGMIISNSEEEIVDTEQYIYIFQEVINENQEEAEALGITTPGWYEISEQEESITKYNGNPTVCYSESRFNSSRYSEEINYVGATEPGCYEWNTSQGKYIKVQGTLNARRAKDIFEELGGTKLVVNSSIGTINDGIFSECDTLKHVVVPEGITKIGDGTFSGCQNLETIKLPHTLTYIGYRALGNNPNLHSITIPNSVTYMGSYILSGSGITNLVLEEGLETIGNSSLSGMQYVDKVVIPDSVTYVGNYAFRGSALSEVVIGKNAGFDGYAFSQTNLRKVVFNMETIPQYFFRNGTSDDVRKIDELVIGNNVRELEHDAFSWLFYVTKLTISSNKIEIPINVLDTDSLQSAIIENPNGWIATCSIITGCETDTETFNFTNDPATNAALLKGKYKSYKLKHN